MNVNLYVKDSRWQESLKWVTKKEKSKSDNMLQIELTLPNKKRTKITISFYNTRMCLFFLAPTVLSVLKAGF